MFRNYVRAIAFVAFAQVLIPQLLIPVPAAFAGGYGQQGYYVEFRSRGGSISGHSYLVAGQIRADGRLRQRHHYGFYVPDNSPEYRLALLGAKGVIRGSKLDRRERPTNRYRLRLSGRKYRLMIRYIRQLKHRTQIFTLLDRNCNHFVARVARRIGLAAPRDTAQFSYDFIARLKEINHYRRRVR